ncbi:MAG: hypothetical protein H6810_01395 [Phycisphaeraceae bacterium]|nr:MAG: hypothetical protein H6810_01395 [Phycisphaeraceae bacterium]
MDGWTLVPLRDEAATTHMIAARDDDELRTTDIDVVLYIRTASGWDAEAYEPSTSKEDALLDLAAEFGLPSPMSGEWMIDDLDPAKVTGTAGQRQPFKSGFFTEDPLSNAAAAMDNPEPLVEAAETVGIPAGGSLVNTGNLTNPIDPEPLPCGCQNACLQDSIAAGIDAMIADGTLAPEEVEEIARVEMQIQFRCCIEWDFHFATSPWQVSCGQWHAVGNGFQQCPCPSDDPNVDNCFYQRDFIETRTRVTIRVCSNCTVFSAVQIQTRTSCQETRESVLHGDPCPDPDGVEEPDGGCVNTHCGPTTTGPWTPPLPPCP